MASPRLHPTRICRHVVSAWWLASSGLSPRLRRTRTPSHSFPEAASDSHSPQRDLHVVARLVWVIPEAASDSHPASLVPWLVSDSRVPRVCARFAFAATRSPRCGSPRLGYPRGCVGLARVVARLVSVMREVVTDSHSPRRGMLLDQSLGLVARPTSLFRAQVIALAVA